MSDIHAVELEIDEAKKMVELGEMARRLYDNRDFKKLIVEDYFRDEAARLVQLSADPRMDKDQRADALAMAQATGHLKRYLSVTAQRGKMAADSIMEHEQTLAELRAEENQ